MRPPDNKVASTATMGKPVCRLAAHRTKRREAPVHCATGTGGQSSKGTPTIGGGGGGRRDGRVCDGCIEEDDDGIESAPSESSDCVSHFTPALGGPAGWTGIEGGGGLGLFADGVEVGDGPGCPCGIVASGFAFPSDTCERTGGAVLGRGPALLSSSRPSDDEPERNVLTSGVSLKRRCLTPGSFRRSLPPVGSSMSESGDGLYPA